MEIDKNSAAKEPPKTINSLPAEVLLKIIEFAQEKSNKNIALVSARFHGLICDVEKFKYPLKLTADSVSVKLISSILEATFILRYWIFLFINPA